MSWTLLPVFFAIAGAIVLLLLAPTKDTLSSLARTMYTAGIWALAFLFAHTVLRLFR